jgi:hypothetical protein
MDLHHFVSVPPTEGVMDAAHTGSALLDLPLELRQNVLRQLLYNDRPLKQQS